MHVAFQLVKEVDLVAEDLVAQDTSERVGKDGHLSLQQHSCIHLPRSAVCVCV